MYRTSDEMTDAFKKLVEFDVGDREFATGFGDLLQAMSRAATLGTDFLLDETKHCEGVHPDVREMVIDSFAKQLVKAFVCLMREQERAENIFGESEEAGNTKPEFPAFNVPYIPTMGSGTQDYNLISDEALELFHQLLAEHKGRASE